MRRFTTFAGTKRLLVAAALIAELVVAIGLLAPSRSAPPVVAMPAAPGPPERATSTTASSSSSAPGVITLHDGRTAVVLVVGGDRGHELAQRIEAELDGAVDAVTAFWGDDWPRRIVVALLGTDEEFAAIGGGGPDIAATTTAERIAFAPEAVDMSVGSLRIVVRHELLHYAARARTAADAPRWLTEGVADFVGRPAVGRPGPKQAAELAVIPSDADLDAPGHRRSLAYDRAWWFSRFVADAYGTPSLRQLYLAACAPGHRDVDAAIRAVLGASTGAVLTAWRAWLSG